jgi:hypothetical protein
MIHIKAVITVVSAHSGLGQRSPGTYSREVAHTHKKQVAQTACVAHFTQSRKLICEW